MRIGNLAFATLLTVVAGCGDSSSAPPVKVIQPDLSVGEFAQPFAGDIAVSSVFDHNLPFQWSDNNGHLLSFWGEKLNGVDGHNGYDWILAEGTPILASGPGIVRFAGSEPPFSCPLLSRTTSGLWVTIAHSLTDGRIVLTQYGHFSRIDVTAGQRVDAGQQLGLSGTTGCSTGPHLHFSAFLQNDVGTSATVVDPFGWQGPTTDPWGVHPLGKASFAFWSTKAPQLFKELRRVGAYPRPRFVSLKALRYLGIDDDHHPNNEFVEFDVNPDLASWDFGGASVSNSRGEAFVFPSGFRVAGGEVVRIYSGAGANSATTLYAGRSKPLWDNTGDCMRLVDTLGRALTGTSWGGVPCGDLSSVAASTAALPLDYTPAPQASMLLGVPVASRPN